MISLGTADFFTASSADTTEVIKLKLPLSSTQSCSIFSCANGTVIGPDYKQEKGSNDDDILSISRVYLLSCEYPRAWTMVIIRKHVTQTSSAAGVTGYPIFICWHSDVPRSLVSLEELRELVASTQPRLYSHLNSTLHNAQRMLVPLSENSL